MGSPWPCFQFHRCGLELVEKDSGQPSGQLYVKPIKLCKSSHGFLDYINNIIRVGPGRPIRMNQNWKL